MKTFIVTVIALILAGLLPGLAHAGTVGDPFSGAPIQINGTPGAATIIEAENFDKGGEGIAYHQPLAGNCSASAQATSDCGCSQGMRPAEAVRICSCLNSPCSPPNPGTATAYITNTETGSWAEYTIEVKATGNYTVELNVAWMDNPCCNDSAYHVELDGVRYPATSNYELGPKAMAGWQTFDWRGKSDPIPMVPGVHRLRIVVDQHWFNWDAIRVKFAAGIEWQTVPVWKVYP